MRETSPYPLTTQCACMDDEGRIWMVSNMVNGLFCLDPDTGKTEYVTSFEREPLFCGSLYTKAFWYKGKVICIPCLAKNIAFYDTVTGEIRYLPIRSEEYLVYFNAVSFAEEKVLLFPVIYSSFAYILDLERESYDSIPFTYGENSHQAEGRIVQGEALCGEKAYFVIRDTNRFFSFDIKTHILDFFQGADHHPFVTMASDGGYLYPFSADGRSYDIYDGGTYITTRQLLPEKEAGKAAVPYEQLKYIACSCVEGAIVNMPMRNVELQFFADGCMKNCVLDWKQIRMADAKIQAFAVCFQRRGKIILLPYHSSTVVEVDLGDASVRYLDISICSSVLNRLCRKLWEQPEHNIQLKEESCSLQRYLDALEDMPSPRTEQDVLQTNGSRIYNILNGQEG